MEAPSELLYSPSHIWVRIEGNRATMGITDWAQMNWGMTLYIEFPELNSTIRAQEIFGGVENFQDTIDLVSPLSGKVVAIHTELEKDTFYIHNSPYHHGWMIVIEFTQPEEIEQLWNAKRYMEQYEE